MTMNKASIICMLTFAIVGSVIFSTHAQAEEKDSNDVRDILVQRAASFCRPLVREWLTSENGIADPAIKARAADCWLAHARLSVLGHESGFNIGTGTSISELPARILESKAEINFDPFLPLAGRTLKFPASIMPPRVE